MSCTLIGFLLCDSSRAVHALRTVAFKHINVPMLEADGIYGTETAITVLAYHAYKGWSLKGQPGTPIAAGTIKALSK